MEYKIGSFNMRNLGKSALGDERDLRKIAEIIRKEGFDVVALQEVLSEGQAFYTSTHTKNSILMELGNDWDFMWANAEGKKDPRGEGYAFLWNKRRLRLASAKLSNGSERTYYPRIYKRNRSDMERQPYYARFTPQGMPGGSNFEIRLICIHTYYGNDSVSDRVKRQRELDVLIKEIYPQIADRVYQNSMPAYTILLGDYNVEIKKPKSFIDIRKAGKSPACLETDENNIIEVIGWDNKKIVTVQHAYTTLKRKIADGGEENYGESGGYLHDYDHFSYEISRFEELNPIARRVDAVRDYCGQDYEKYYKTISDHVPIVLSITLN